MKEKRIAFLFTGEYPCGGAESVISIVTSYIASRGFKVYIVGMIREEFLSERDRQNAEFITKTQVELEPKQLADTCLRVCRELALDIVAIQCTQMLDIEYVTSNTTTKVVNCEHGQIGWELITRMSRRRKKAATGPLCYLKYHLLTIPMEWAFRPLYHQWLKQYRLTYDCCAAYTLLCEEYKTSLSRQIGVDGAKFYAINNPLLPLIGGVNLEKEKELIFLGRLTHDDKRVDKLLRIWALLYRDFPDWRLSIVGDGEDKEMLQRLAVTLSLERITFENYTPDPTPYYRRAAILCLTSDMEGWGMVLAEAQQAGVIPIAFDRSAGVRTVLSPSGENGILVPPRAGIKGYARALRALMSDEGKRRQMQQNVLLKAKQYDSDYICSQWCEMLKSI